MASSLFIDISACGILDVWIESIQPGLCGQQGKVNTTRWIPDGNYHSSRAGTVLIRTLAGAVCQLDSAVLF